MQTLQQYLQPHCANTDLNALLQLIADACQQICSDLQLGAMAGILGSAEAENVQGETQKKLDVIANDILKQALLQSPQVKALASEEEEDIVNGHSGGRFLVAFDPLDGSSNIDINSMVGTIFSIYQCEHHNAATEQDFLQPGRQQVAAGYVLYGPSCMLVLTTGNGVSMFTLDQRQQQYVLTDDAVSIAASTREFAINMSNQRFWAAPMQRYISDLLAGDQGPRGKNFNMRWVAAMVADVHRVLCRGGLFTYPWDQRNPDKAGKLRLMYEANPMALLVEQAGGEAWTDQQPILDLQPQQIHQRVPVILGSAEEVRCCIDYHQNG